MPGYTLKAIYRAGQKCWLTDAKTGGWNVARVSTFCPAARASKPYLELWMIRCFLPTHFLPSGLNCRANVRHTHEMYLRERRCMADDKLALPWDGQPVSHWHNKKIILYKSISYCDQKFASMKPSQKRWKFHFVTTALKVLFLVHCTAPTCRLYK